MTMLPQRVSLVAQVADLLRKGVAEGRWTNHLPSERALSDQLQVSRFTVRAALRLLRRDGTVAVSGRRHKIQGHSIPRRSPSVSRLAVVLSPEPLYAFSQFKLFQMDELRRHLHGLGYTLEIRADARLQNPRKFAVLEEIVRQTPPAWWLLNLSTEDVQRWFAKRGVPVIIMGTRHRGVDLPAIDFDYRAVCAHAVATFWRNGHRRVVYLTPRASTAGNLVSNEGFLEGAARVRDSDCEYRIVEHDGTVHGIERSVSTLIRSASPPTGFFVSHALHLLTVMTQLARLGRRVPRDVSVLLRQNDPIVSYVLPTIAAYEFNNTRYPLRLSKMIVQLSGTGGLPSRQVLIPGELRAGESLAKR